MNATPVLIVAALAVAGCAAAPPQPAEQAQKAVPSIEPPTDGGPVAPAQSPLAGEIVNRARGLLGTPYRFGGADPGSGFDCSGLVFFVFSQAGLRLPRSAESQQSAVVRIEREALAPGDLVFFRLPEPHVGIYAGDGTFIHAPGRGRAVEVARLSEPWFALGFAGAGRIGMPGEGSPGG